VKKLSLISCLICLLIPGSVALSQPFPSFMLDTSRTLMPVFDDPGGTRVAFGPDLGLVVWASHGVRGVRVDRNGALLDSVQIDISGANLHGGQPAVAWSGQNFLVAWAGYDEAACAIVEPDGRVTSRAVFPDSDVDRSGAEVAFDGTNFLATWISAPPTLGLTAFFSRVSPQGVVLDSPPRMVAPLAAGRQEDVALCFHADRYLAAWSDWDTIGLSGNFIFPDGSIADSAGFHIRRGGIAQDPALTHNRNHFIISWYDGWRRVRVARVSDSGAVLDTGGVLIDSFSSPSTALVSTGDTTLLLFRRDSVWDGDSLTLVALRLDTALNHLDAEPVKLSAPGYAGYGYAAEDPAAALCGNDYFIAWSQPISGFPVEDCYQALCRRMNRNGELLDSTPVILSYEAATQCYPDLASDGENFLAVWNDIRRDPVLPVYSVYGSRFAADGTLLDSAPIWLGSSDYRKQPAVAFGGGYYLSAWYYDRGISARRVTPAGVILDSVPLRMPGPDEARGFPNVAFGDSIFLVVWPTWSAIHGCRVTPSGALLDTAPLQLAVTQTAEPEYPRVAFDGVNFLVARHDGDGVHRCLRVGTNGVILDTADITLDEHGWYAAPELAYGDGVYLVVDNWNSKCWRVSPSGTLLDSVPHSYLDNADVVFDGTDFMILTQFRDAAGQLTNSLGAMRITTDGRVLDSTPLTLVTADSARASARFAAMATNAANRVGVAFTSDEPAPYLTTRIRAATFPAIVGVGSEREHARPVALRVQPNPASGLASLSFNLTQAGPVQVTAFDATGRRCASLFSGQMKAGSQKLSVDTRRLANGVYFLRLEAGAATRSARLVVSH
jgi:hypothetical protein